MYCFTPWETLLGEIPSQDRLVVIQLLSSWGLGCHYCPWHCQFAPSVINPWADIVRGRPGGVLGSLLVCREGLKKFMDISKDTNVGQMPGSTLSFLFLLSYFYAHWGGDL
jgi:hypothetical protein